MKKIPISNSELFTTVDDVDYEPLNKYKWRLAYSSNRTTIYAVTSMRIDGKFKNIKMHRLIMNAPENEVVDHRDFNGLNNCRSNLRLCSGTQNSRNRRPYGKSKYLGVHLAISNAKFKNGTTRSYSYWRARIKVAERFLSLGCFPSEIEAAKAYDKAASQYYGEFANLNFKSK